MDKIDFENVSLREAKAALDERDKKPQSARSEWDSRRKLPAPEDTQLQEYAIKWIKSLPLKVQPRNLAMKFPRIANKLAKVWERKAECERVLDELMIDDRGNRQGFPMQVAAEIMALKVHYSTEPLDNTLDWTNKSDGRVI